MRSFLPLLIGSAVVVGSVIIVFEQFVPEVIKALAGV